VSGEHISFDELFEIARRQHVFPVLCRHFDSRIAESAQLVNIKIPKKSAILLNTRAFLRYTRFHYLHVYLRRQNVAALNAISEALQKGKADEVKNLVTQALEEKVEVKKVLEEGLIAAMDIIGGRFKRNEIYIPEVLIAARAMHAGMSILEPMLAESGIKMIGKIAIGTVKGDLHDIGKNLVAMMYKGAGFDVQDLGVDIPAEKFVQASDDGADIVGLSALLTTTMVQMKSVIESLKEKGSKAKIIIGGAPVTQNYCDEVGADGYAADAATAVEIGKSLIKG
jgi:5-methyltetrahydrofolate--homocysteine methyltransferase